MINDSQATVTLDVIDTSNRSRSESVSSDGEDSATRRILSTGNIQVDEESLHEISLKESKIAEKQIRKRKRVQRKLLKAYNPTPPGSPLWLHIVNWIFISLLGALMFYFTKKVSDQYFADIKTPPTVTNYLPNSSASFPRITLCQSAPRVPLTFLSCIKFDRNVVSTTEVDTRESNCSYAVEYRSDLEKDLLGNFSCYTVNNDTSLVATSPGFFNSIDLRFDMHLDQYPPGDLAGLYVFFEERFTTLGKPDIVKVSGTTTVAVPAFATAISINKRIMTYYLQEPIVYYDAVSNLMALTPDNSTLKDLHSSVYVSISYNDLATQNTVQEPAYKIQNALGDFAGMLGTLVGVDIWKIIFWVEVFPRFALISHKKLKKKGVYDSVRTKLNL